MVVDVGLSESAGSALDGLVGDTEVLKETERIRRGETVEDVVVVRDVVLVLPPKKGKSVGPVLNHVSFGVREGTCRCARGTNDWLHRVHRAGGLHGFPLHDEALATWCHLCLVPQGSGCACLARSPVDPSCFKSSRVWCTPQRGPPPSSAPTVDGYCRACPWGSRTPSGTRCTVSICGSDRWLSLSPPQSLGFFLACVCVLLCNRRKHVVSR